MGRPPRRGQPLNKGQDGGSERVHYSEVSLYYIFHVINIVRVRVKV